MTRAHPSLLLLTLLVYFPQISTAQVQTGTPPFGSFGGGPEAINLANLNSHITVPVRQRSGRGMDFTYNLSYDSLVWYPVGVSGSQNWQPMTNWGWKGQTQTALGYISYGFTNTTQCLMDVFPRQYGTTYWYKNWVYVDEFGSAHSFGLFSVYDSDCYGTSSGSAVATDGSGYTLNANGNPSATVTPRGGGVINAPLQSPTGSGSKKDSNGNLISVSAGSPQTFTDTLGTTALTINGSAPNPVSYTYKNAAGTSVSVTINYQAYTVKTNFGVSGISEYGPTNVSLIDHITLANGKQYGFTYEQTPGTCTPLAGTYQGYCVTARIASVTLPTGGQIAYAYSGGSNGIFSDGSTATLTRTIPDGQWTYARTQGTAPASTTTITDPQNNQTLIQFQGIYETQRQSYQGSAQTGTLLQTVNTCYNGSASPCTATAVTLPITRRTAIVQLDSAGSQSKTDLFLNSYGLPTETDEYEYGSGAPGPLVRKTLVTYASLGNGIVDHPATITVCTASGTSSSCGGTGTQVAQATISYDQTAVTATTGVPQHVAVTGSRGNPTTVKQWISGTTYATSTMTYYDTGNVRTVTDPGVHQTTISYSDSWGDAACPPTANTQAYPTQITNPLSQNTQIKYFQCTAQPYSVKDPNDIANGRNGTVFTYADSLSRLTKADFADTGQTTVAYDDTARTITTTQKQTSTVSISETDQFDQLGRLTQRQLPGTRKVDTIYDSLGRVWKTSNPYINTTDSTYGLTETQYDPLSRVKKLIRQDGTSFTLLEYSGNAVRVTDDSGKKRLALSDALGRLTKVCEVAAGNTRSPNEPCAISGFTESGYVTTNAYDVLDNVTQIVQGTAAPQQQTRTMAYDGLGRITSAAIPEVSTASSVTYGYDLDSNRTSVTDPRGAVNFVYDVLHRLTQKKHGTTLVAQYTYDGTAANNAIGRLVTDTDGAFGSGADKSDYTYDPLGRVLTANRTASGTPYTIAYGYDLMGSLTQLTYPSGRIVTYAYNSSAELTQVRDATSAPGFDYVTGASYSPLGTLQQLNLANQVSTTLGWNNLARLTSILTQKSAGPALLNLGYGHYANGQIQQITNNLDSLKTEKYTYDDLGRLLTAQRGPDTNIQRTYSYDYDRFGNRWGQNLVAGSGFGGTNSFDYASNRVTSTGFSFDASGNLTANGAGTSYTFNPENFMATAGASVTYSVDTLGRRTKKTVSGTTTNYFYSGSVVISEKQGSTWTDYVFFGDQRIARIDLGSVVVRFTNDSCSACGGTPVGGGDRNLFVNSITIGSTTILPNDPSVSYTSAPCNGYYNGVGTLACTGDMISSTPASAPSITVNVYGSPDYNVYPHMQLWVNGTLVGEWDVTGTAQIYTATRVRYYSSDHLGSTRVCTDSNGNLIGACDYEPFGEFQPGSSCSNLPTNYRFAGMEYDSETALYHTIFRQYDPNQGRWVSVDALPGSPSDPQSLNRYTYVANDTANLVDPSGLCSLSITYDVHYFWSCTDNRCVLIGGYIEITSAKIVGVCGERGGGQGGAGGGGRGQPGTPKPPGLPGFSQAAYSQCANQAFGSTSGNIPGTDRSIPGYDAALAIFQASLLTGADSATVAGTMAFESNFNLAVATQFNPGTLSADVGPMQLNTGNIGDPSFPSFPGAYGSAVVGEPFNGNVLANVMSGASYLNRLRRHPENYAAPLYRRGRRRSLRKLDQYLRSFFDCLARNSVPSNP